MAETRSVLLQLLKRLCNVVCLGLNGARINYFPLSCNAPLASTLVHFYLISSSDDLTHSLEMKQCNVTQIKSVNSRGTETRDSSE